MYRIIYLLIECRGFDVVNMQKMDNKRNNIEESNVNDSLEVRPVVYLKPRMLTLSGDGSFKEPYVIK